MATIELSKCVDGGIVPSEDYAPSLIITTGIIGIIFSIFLLKQVASVVLDVASVPGTTRNKDSAEANVKLEELYQAISLGASSFLNAEYKLCALFVVVVFPSMSALIAWGSKTSPDEWAWPIGLLSGVSFVVGAVTSMISGFIGMRVAVFSNARCTVGACSPTIGWTESFNTAFKAGGVMGFSLTGIALLSLYGLLCTLKPFFSDDQAGMMNLMEVVAGFGLGGSSIAMFGRVGGGIYTKAADVGADLAGKVVQDLPEDDPHNPGTIADNVGDNVGDGAHAFLPRPAGALPPLRAAPRSRPLAPARARSRPLAPTSHACSRPPHAPARARALARLTRPLCSFPSAALAVAGMGSDLFGSFGEASCAALLVGASSAGIYSAGWGALMFPLTISGAGIIVCLVTNFFATDLFPVKQESDIEKVLKTQLLVSSVLMTPVVYDLP